MFARRKFQRLFVSSFHFLEHNQMLRCFSAKSVGVDEASVTPQAKGAAGQVMLNLKLECGRKNHWFRGDDLRRLGYRLNGGDCSRGSSLCLRRSVVPCSVPVV